MQSDLSRDQFSAAELLLVPECVMLRDGPVRDFAVVVSDHKFRDVGPAPEVMQRNTRLTAVEMPGKILMPGFIDAHHHLTQSFGKALAFGEPSEIFRRIWVPLESSLDDEFVYLTAKLAALESLRGGFTTVCDAGTRAKGDIASLAEATRDAGLRCVLGLVCNDGGNDSTPQQRRALLDKAAGHLARWDGNALVHPSLAVSVPEVASDEMLRATTALCREAGAIFQTHVNEHLASAQRSIVARGLRPLELLHSLGALGPQMLIAHGALLTPVELNVLADTGTGVIYNPVARQWMGNAVAA